MLGLESDPLYWASRSYRFRLRTLSDDCWSCQSCLTGGNIEMTTDYVRFESYRSEREYICWVVLLALWLEPLNFERVISLLLCILSTYSPIDPEESCIAKFWWSFVSLRYSLKGTLRGMHRFALVHIPLFKNSTDRRSCYGLVGIVEPVGSRRHIVSMVVCRVHDFHVVCNQFGISCFQ